MLTVDKKETVVKMNHSKTQQNEIQGHLDIKKEYIHIYIYES